MQDSNRYPGAAVLRPRGYPSTAATHRRAQDNFPAAVFSLAFWCALTATIFGWDVLGGLLSAGF